MRHLIIADQLQELGHYNAATTLRDGIPPPETTPAELEQAAHEILDLNAKLTTSYQLKAHAYLLRSGRSPLTHTDVHAYYTKHYPEY